MEFYTDGGAKPNPGEKAIVITDRDGKIVLSKKTGYGTTNEAEYEAVIEALKIAKELGSSSVVVYTNSALLINHMKGVWKMQEKFKPLVEEIKTICTSFSKSFIAHRKTKDNLAHKGVEKLLSGDIDEIKIKESEMKPSIVSIPVNLNAPLGKEKSGTKFSIMVDYRDDVLNVYVEPKDADLLLVEAVLKSAMVEVSIQRMHHTKNKMEKNAKKKRSSYVA